MVKFWSNPQDSGKTLNILRCQFLNNSVSAEDNKTTWGGAVVAIGGLINITESIFTGNSGEDTSALSTRQLIMIIESSSIRGGTFT